MPAAEFKADGCQAVCSPYLPAPLSQFCDNPCPLFFLLAAP